MNSEAISGVIDNLRRVFQAVNDYSKNAEKATGLTGPQLWAVKLVANASSLKVSELARQMYLHPATVVGILDRLEAKGLVVRRRSTEDRRVVEISLTDAGSELVASSPEVAQVILVRGLAALSDDVFDKVAEGVEEIVRILGAQEIIPLPLLTPEEKTLV